MPQATSVKFANAQASPANLPVAKVQLLLGNYASAAAYGTVASGNSAVNFPPGGAIDGDRTEINVGAPSAADNSVGGSSWQSTVTPDSQGVVHLFLTFSKARTINRIKLYHMAGRGLKSYTVSYLTNAGYITFLATPDLASPGVTLFTTTLKLDTLDFPDITTTSLDVAVYHTQVPNDVANIIELEVYRKIDITDRIKGIKVSRQRDYKLANPMAATVQLDCINTDRFFSISHAPTAKEATAGFVNSELQPNIQIIITFGFNLYGAAPEMVPCMVAYLDAITPRPKTRDCRITGRDGMKSLINYVDSTNLKTNIDIAEAVRYVLNRGNVSNYEMSIVDTGINLPYFFTDQEDHLTTIRELTQAAVDANFFFNESGIAVFQFYSSSSSSLPLSFTYPTESPWASGTLAGNMEVNGSNQLQLNVQFVTPAVFQNSNTHTVFVGTTNGLFQINQFAQSFAMPYTAPMSSFTFVIQYESSADRTATFSVFADNGGTPGSTLFSTSVFIPNSSNVIVTRNINISPSLTLNAGNYWYGLNTGSLVNFALVGGNVDRASTAQTGPVLPSPYSRTLGMNPNQGTWQTLVATNDNNNPVFAWGFFVFYEASGSGTWTSPVLDTGSATVSFQPLAPISVVNGDTITYLTQTSPDGIHWSGFVATAANFQPQSPVARYFQSQVSIVQSPLSGVSALILDLTVNWTTNSSTLGVPKYPPAPSSFTFDFNSNLVDVTQELADNLGGDTSIVNDVTVQAAPLLLTGADTDTAWQATVGTPPVNVSASVPLPMTAGVPITIAPYIAGGMDTSRMSGPNPAAVAISTAPGDLATFKFTVIHPTLPVLVITPVTSGTITDLRIVGKTFSSSNVLQAANEVNNASVQKFGNRKQNLQNKWIASPALADVIAKGLLLIFGNPFSYISGFEVQPTFSLQIGDRITVKDVNLDLSADYVAVGVDHEFSMSGDKGTVKTTGKLLAVPAGL